jgi:hypothetical protein
MNKGYMEIQEKFGVFKLARFTLLDYYNNQVSTQDK